MGSREKRKNPTEFFFGEKKTEKKKTEKKNKSYVWKWRFVRVFLCGMIIIVLAIYNNTNNIIYIYMYIKLTVFGTTVPFGFL